MSGILLDRVLCEPLSARTNLFCFRVGSRAHSVSMNVRFWPEAAIRSGRSRSSAIQQKAAIGLVEISTSFIAAIGQERPLSSLDTS